MSEELSGMETFGGHAWPCSKCTVQGLGSAVTDSVNIEAINTMFVFRIHVYSKKGFPATQQFVSQFGSVNYT